MKRWMWLAGGAALLVLIIAGSIAGGDPKGEKVYAEPVARRNIESIVSASGEIDPKLKVNISAHVIGKIDRLYFKEGDQVRRGQKLVDLERVAFTAQRDRMRSEVANRRIEVARAKIALSNAELQYRRAQKMREQGIQAEELFDRATFELSNARSALAAAEESVRQAVAGLKQGDDDLSRTTILSPIDGKVVALNAHEGEVVVTGTMNNAASVIAVIADLSEVLVEAEVGETEIVQIRTGQRAKVIVDAIGDDKPYDGSVVEIGSSASQLGVGGSSGTRYFKVKVALEHADERLRPGMTAQVDIIAESLANAIAVPVQSVLERAPSEIAKSARGKKDESDDEDEPKKKYVAIVDKDEIDMVEVTTGISSATHVAITSGLKGGERIVTGPFRSLRKLHEGDTVRVEKETKAGSGSDSEDEKEGKE